MGTEKHCFKMSMLDGLTVLGLKRKLMSRRTWATKMANAKLAWIW